MTENTKKPRILYVASTLPCPPMQGSHHRILNIGRQLQKRFPLTFLYVGHEPERNRIEATQKEFFNFCAMTTRHRNLPYFLSQWRHRFQFHWPWYHAPAVSKSDLKRFHQLVKDHDLIWFHTLDPADSLRYKGFRNSLVDLDDLNQVKYRLKLSIDKTLRLKIADYLLIYKWKRWEKNAIHRFGKIVVCSDEDKAFLGNRDPIAVVPNGFEQPPERPRWKPKTKSCLGFIGYLGYTPNRDGMKWFADRVWPKIREEIPTAELHLVGRYDAKSDFSYVEGFTHLGFVDDPAGEFSQWSAMIVPLHFGGGTRIKILEAFTKMCPVITTSVGSHGLMVADEKELIVRDQEDAFAQGCVRLINDPQIGQQLTKAAWSTFEDMYSWDKIGEKIYDFVLRSQPFS
ncbi:MAG: glycosyltransferase family 4 protein [Sedimentisphaerales bacterium]|nr:glycosyltransferase family 4 protein [Sedimentisphaerales bacterium]